MYSAPAHMYEKRCNYLFNEGFSISTHALNLCLFCKMTNQLLLFHALHENDEQVLGLRAAVGESLLDGHQQLVSQRLINYTVKAEVEKKCQEGCQT